MPGYPIGSPDRDNNAGMPGERNVTTFDDHADTYDQGRMGRWNQAVATRAADVALAVAPVPLRVLDIGCGTGMVLRELSERLPNALELVGVDPSLAMLKVARERSDGRSWFVQGTVEQLPLPDDHFDLIVCSLSFHHWADQRRGLTEARRVLAPDGFFVLVDLSGFWLRGERANGTLKQVAAVAESSGLIVDATETVHRLVLLPQVSASILVR